MKRFALLLTIALFTIQVWSSQLVLIPVKNFEETKSLLEHPSLTIHFFRDEFVIATLYADPKPNFIILDHNPWTSGMSYYVVYFDQYTDKLDYQKRINSIADVLYDGGSFAVLRIDETIYGQLPPAKNDGMVRLFNHRVVLPKRLFYSESSGFNPDPFVIQLMNQVSGSNITATVTHLQNYTTRNCYKPQGILAQNWLKNQYEALGLSVEVMDFYMPGGPASDNIIATKIGTKYPNEYVVLGAHYDSLSWSGDEPGADDNASGSAGVLEIARILSQYNFDRSIIFCAFSGEEYGLYGSAAYASRCKQQGMNILGYFNMDMTGYLKPGNTTIMTSLIYPPSAQELATFYTNVCATYLPDFLVVPATFSGGDSDHTSFNNNGYMGIFPFEDVNNYSPYIHTSNDLVGPSYNNEAQAVIFTKAVLASVATMANMKMPPKNLKAIPGDQRVKLTWNPMTEIDYFKIYRNGSFIATSLTNQFTDFTVTNGQQYQYYVTAIYSDTGEESSPSNTVSAIPMPPILLPIVFNFENGAPYWNFEGTWGLSTTAAYSPIYSLTESPTGNYANNLNISARLAPINLNLGYTSASISFWTRYNIENNWDFMYLEVSTDGVNWSNLATFTGVQNTWVQKTYSLNNYLNQPEVHIRFRFYSDPFVVRDGMYIDDLTIQVTGGYHLQVVSIPHGWSGISSYIVPAQPQITQVMQSLLDNLIIVQSLDAVYWPGQNINTIGNWNSHQGYKIKLMHNATHYFAGFPEINKTLNLAQGWNLIPVLSTCQVNCQDLFGPVLNQILLIKEIASTRIFWPSQNISTLQGLVPGKSYYVYTLSPVSITFPECTKHSTSLPLAPDNFSPVWDLITPTANSHVIGIPFNVLQNFSQGDLIGVFTPGNFCVGMIEIENMTQNVALVAFANDTITPGTDGFLEGEPMIFRLFENSTGQEFSLLATFDNTMPDAGLFKNEGISLLTSLVIDNTSVSNDTFKSVIIFPNPARGQLSIRLPFEDEVILRLLTITGQKILENHFNGHTVINTQQLSPGVYTLQLSNEQHTESFKIVIR